MTMTGRKGASGDGTGGRLRKGQLIGEDNGGVDDGGGFGGGGRGLDIADVVVGDAVEAVSVAIGAGVGAACGGGGGEPGSEDTAVVGDEDVVVGDAGAVGIILAAPCDGEGG